MLAWPDRSRLAVLYVMLAAYAASVVMFYVFARYRLPLVPMLLLFASAGIAALPQWLRSAGSRQRSLVAGAVLAAAVFSNWPMLSKPLMKAITETNLAVALQASGHERRGRRPLPSCDRTAARLRAAYNNLGVLQRASGKVDEAIATYEQALALKGDYPDAHYNLANALLQKNRPREAADHFRIALRSIPDSAGAANNLGIALAAEDKPQDAVAAFRAAVAADPNAAVAHRNLADALASAGQVPEAIAEFQRAIALDPKDPASQYNFGVVLLQAGRSGDAVVALRAAVALSPQSVDAHNNLGIALGSSGDLKGATDQFRQALAIDATSADARRNLEMAEQALGQTPGRQR